jgi:DNA-binding MarR family transcriptional regulator
MNEKFLDSSAGYLLTKTAMKLTSAFGRKIKDYNVTTEEFVLLARLIEEDGISQNELALRSEKYPPGVTRMLNSMETKGLIKRVNIENDKRRFAIYLTDKARSAYMDLERLERQIMEEVTDDLTNEQIEVLTYSLRQIKKKIEQLN